MVIKLEIGQSAVSSPTSDMIGYGEHSTTERMLVCDDGLINRSMLKIQSSPLWKLWGSHGNEYARSTIGTSTY
jgi:hypothetical protein